MSLTVALKAKPIAYSAIAFSEFVNASGLAHIATKFEDVNLLDNADKESNVAVDLDGNKKEYGSEKVVAAFLEKFPDLFLGKNEASSVQPWIELAAALAPSHNFMEVSNMLAQLDDHLIMRTLFVGYSLTIADMAVWGALKANNMAAGAVRTGQYHNLARWYRFMDTQKPFATALENFTKAVNASKKQKSSGPNYEIGLPDAIDGKVVTRFPPEPSGYLHIGHAKAALLNEYFAKKYHGKLIVRFDDTNPSKENVEFQDAILEDVALLGIKPDVVTYTSDYMDHIHDLCIEMIKSGQAYADDTEVEQMRAERNEGIPSRYRERPAEESLAIFAEMDKGSDLGLKNCIRAKISYENPNKALRDPVIYRCNLLPHHRTGTKYKAYPTYDFACPIVDSLEGVTHALRTTEYRDRNPMYQWMLKAMNLRKVHVWEFSRMNFVRTLLSKRKLTALVDHGLVWGWDDPRFPTVRGVRRRGMTIDALQQYIISQGPSKNILTLDWTSFWATNKKIIDPNAPRHTAVAEEGLVKATLTNGPEAVYTKERLKHKKNPSLGNRNVVYSRDVLIEQADASALKKDEEVTLMDWGNAFVKEITRDESGKVTALKLELHLEGDFKKTEKKVTWLADTHDKVLADLVDFDYLITKDKLEEDDDYKEFLTPQTEFHTSVFADNAVKDLKKGDIVQIERKGYFIVDTPFDGNGITFFNIPDGKTVNRYGSKN
ncbi:glutamate-tRNA ligase [Schizosaccharomyces cryophilus OY26]|uniref:glutamate--tRNA ligase n=1 Tax=Schizosaccharomyces cryophilus (strain OY26 / ATCC MYA-4695 / CBS 11777 / NBRC 106824 / NRRL Y48691) TaxID=653667 RepID=S9X8H4_SCHCR|nr:glutamate-tRNA ligase [Schizosaccharomyces cryophilus OY26]EPY53432.1 glutamate-tRNA ligase [Schizosaccharomyces cryophilus OY26]